MRRVKVTSPTLTWGETLRPQRLTPHRARVANHLPGNARLVDAVPASPTGAGVILSPSFRYPVGRVPSLVGHQDSPSGLWAARARVHRTGVRW